VSQDCTRVLLEAFAPPPRWFAMVFGLACIVIPAGWAFVLLAR
jgi:hypothetical protein